MKKIKKVIRVDVDKCTGCRSCEVACSAFHASPKYSIVNPARSRVRVFRDELRDAYSPVYATEYTEAECRGHRIYTAGGKVYNDCSFCGASCPSRDLFKEPDSGLPLKCDMCEDDPPLEKPMCVQACEPGCLTYEEREVEEKEEEEKPDEIEIGLQELTRKHGVKTVKDALARISKG